MTIHNQTINTCTISTSYSIKRIRPIILLDETSYKGGTNGKTHPIAWYRDFDGGRSFYTGLGHVEESYTDTLFLKHLLGGIQYAMGVKKMEPKLRR